MLHCLISQGRKFIKDLKLETTQYVELDSLNKIKDISIKLQQK
jgi:hypothetical protein